MTHAPATARPPLWRRLLPRRWYTRAALLLFLTILLAAGIAALLLYRTPAWYRPMTDPGDPRVDLLAQSTQNKLLDLHHNIPQRAVLHDETWTLTQDEANAFLAVQSARLKAATTAAGEQRITAPMIVFRENQIIFAARTSKVPGTDPHGGVISLGVAVKTLPPEPGDKTSRVLITIDSLQVGSLPLPKSLAQKRLDKMTPALVPVIREIAVRSAGSDMDKEMPKIVDWLDHIRRGEPMAMDLQHRGRQLALRQVKVNNGSITITVGPPDK